MQEIIIWVENLLESWGLTGDTVTVVRFVVLVITAIVLSFLAGYVFKKILIPVVRKLTARTPTKWDDVLLNNRVLTSFSNIVPAVVIWQLLPWVFMEYATVREVLARLTAIYITIMMTRTSIVFIDSFKLLEGDKRTATQQYLYSFCGVLKIVMIGIAVIVTISIVINQSPATLLAGLGAASAVTMLVFQDTIKGLVAGIRLTSNDMLHKGDWITVPAAGANGTVEEITLTTVKVRNFDNTITTVTPQTLVDGSFQNWIGMQQGNGRRSVRKVFFNYRSLRLVDDEKGQRVSNLTLYRRHMEDYLAAHPHVNASLGVMARQMDGTPTGLPVEFTFWLNDKDWATYEHVTSEIMEYAYSAASDYGLAIYQQSQTLE